MNAFVRIAVTFTGCLLVTGSGGALVYSYLSDRHQADMDQEIRLQMEALQDDMRLELGSISNSLAFLVDEIQTHSPLDDAQSKRRLEDDFVSFMKTSHYYDQARLLDMAGKEILRVNYNNGKPALVPEHGLQNKSGRYYYREGLKLGQGQAYMSPFDLNIENGVIEQPLKPTIRLVQPAFDSGGHQLGMAVVNVLGAPLLSHLQSESKAMPVKSVWLLNSGGYWLTGSDSKNLWAFMYPGRESRSLASREPDVWNVIRDRAQARVDADGGVYLSETLYPERELSRAGLHVTGGDGRVWKLVAFYPREMLENAMHDQYWLVVAVSVGSAVALTIILLGQIRLRRQSEMRHLAEIRAREQVKESEKTQAIVTIAGGMAHEFNNMLAGILGSAYLLRNDLYGQLEELHLLDRIERLGERASQLVRHMLTFAQADVSETERLKLDDVVAGELEALRPSLPASIRMEVEITETPLYLMGNRNNLATLLQHLVSNAVDAMADVESPRLRISLDRVSPPADLQSGSDRPYACLSVRDNGRGIAASALPFIFDPFYTTKDPGQGTGMGLAFASGMVHAMQGWIKTDSVEGQGTTLQIFLPLEDVPAD